MSLNGRVRVRPRTRVVSVAPLLAVTLLLSIFTGAHSVPLARRSLTQESERTRSITKNNVQRLGDLVREADPKTVFMIGENVSLSTQIHVGVKGLVFRGINSAERPAIECAPGKGAFVINSDATFENLSLVSCDEHALNISNTAAATENDVRNADTVAVLNIVLRHVYFSRNGRGRDSTLSAAVHVYGEVHMTINNCHFDDNWGLRGAANNGAEIESD